MKPPVVVGLVIEHKKALVEMRKNLQDLRREIKLFPVKQKRAKDANERNNRKAFKAWYKRFAAAINTLSRKTEEEVYKAAYNTKPGWNHQIIGGLSKLGLKQPPQLAAYHTELTVSKLEARANVLALRISMLELSSARVLRIRSDKWARYSKGL